MNGASDEETVAHIRELVSSGMNHVPGAKSTSEKIEEMLRTTITLRDDLKDEIDGKRVNNDNGEDEDDDDDDEDAVSSCDPETASSANNHGRKVALVNDSVCSNNSLIGPVTDLWDIRSHTPNSRSKYFSKSLLSPATWKTNKLHFMHFSNIDQTFLWSLPAIERARNPKKTKTTKKLNIDDSSSSTITRSIDELFNLRIFESLWPTGY